MNCDLTCDLYRTNVCVRTWRMQVFSLTQCTSSCWEPLWSPTGVGTSRKYSHRLYIYMCTCTRVRFKFNEDMQWHPKIFSTPSLSGTNSLKFRQGNSQKFCSKVIAYTCTRTSQLMREILQRSWCCSTPQVTCKVADFFPKLLQNGDKPILTWFSSLNVILVTISTMPSIHMCTTV